MPEIRDGLTLVSRCVLVALLRLDADDWVDGSQVVEEVRRWRTIPSHKVVAAIIWLAGGVWLKAGHPVCVEWRHKESSAIVETPNPSQMECRLTSLGRDMLFIDTLPQTATTTGDLPNIHSLVPLLLLYGWAGVGWGMACSVLPHNLTELIKATLTIIRYPMTTARCIPDLYEGGEMDISDYADGHGRIATKVSICCGDEHMLVIRALPQYVCAASLMESIRTAANAGTVAVEEVADHSRVEVDIRLRIPATMDPLVVKRQLYSNTECAQTIPCSLMVTRDGKVTTMTVGELIADHARRMLINSHFTERPHQQKREILDQLDRLEAVHGRKYPRQTRISLGTAR